MWRAALALLLTVIAGVAWRPASTHGTAACAHRQLEARTGAALAYDPSTRRVLLYGGETRDSTDPRPRSLWAWDGARWHCLDANGPPGRSDAALAFDQARRRLVLYGGRVEGTLFRDTWEWDGTRWNLADSAGPPERIHAVLAYDPSRRAVILHGGLGVPGPDQFRRDSWAWDATRWRPLDLSSAPTSGDHHNALVSTPDGPLLMIVAPDSAGRCVSDSQFQRGRAMLFALRTNRWTPLDSAGPCFSGLAPAVWTPEGLVMVQSADFSDTTRQGETWLWRDRAWRRLGATLPRRANVRMAYDAARQRAVLVTSDDSRDALETWEWDGERWQRR